MYKTGHIRNKQKKEHEPCLLTVVYSCSSYLQWRNGVWSMEEKEKKYIVVVSNGRWCNFKCKVLSSDYFDGKCGLLFNETLAHRREKVKLKIKMDACMKYTVAMK